MTKRKISINRKSKDWKNKYPMVEIHWVDIVSDSSWQSLKQLKELQFKKQFCNQMEILNRQSLPLQQDFEKKVQKYFSKKIKE